MLKVFLIESLQLWARVQAGTLWWKSLPSSQLYYEGTNIFHTQTYVDSIMNTN